MISNPFSALDVELDALANPSLRSVPDLKPDENAFGVAAQLSQLSSDLVAENLDETAAINRALHLIAQLVPAVSNASLARTDGTRSRFLAHTDGAVEWLEQAQLRCAEGPCWDAVGRSEIIIVSSWQGETRWPTLLTSVAAEFPQSVLGAQSIVCTPLGTGGHPEHCLMLCSPHSGAFNGLALHLVTVAAASMALLLTAIERSALANHLTQALDSNRRIGAAMGILMAGSRCSEQEAFTALRQVSQTRHVKLREVADEVIYTGAIPSAGPRRRVHPRSA